MTEDWRDRRIQELEEALEFYADPENWFALAVFADPPCGPIMYDIRPDDVYEPMGRATHGAFARAVLMGEKFQPPLDDTDWEEKYGHLVEEEEDV